jgi:hypothetical protein
MLRSNDKEIAMEAARQLDWSKLAGKVVFFQHESVGRNILDGIAEIKAADKRSNLTVTDNPEAANSSGALLIESRSGRNGDPLAKIENFKQVLDRGVGARANIAILKFCYVDVTGTTDIPKLFGQYKESFSSLRSRYPGIKFVHATVPLKVNEVTWKTQVKEWIGMDKIWEYEDNVARGKYNDLLRGEYRGKEPILDLALFEATRADGGSETFRHNGADFQALVPEFSSDGAHLNEAGRKIVAIRMVEFLSGL